MFPPCEGGKERGLLVAAMLRYVRDIAPEERHILRQAQYISIQFDTCTELVEVSYIAPKELIWVNDTLVSRLKCGTW